MSGQTYLTVAYLGMIGALALWTWTVFARSKTLQNKIDSLEKAMESKNETVVVVDIDTPESVESDN
tara:strand:- start:178 stop:375 length:198 start_codon:yes stop_codon:yes gene_type:complete